MSQPRRQRARAELQASLAPRREAAELAALWQAKVDNAERAWMEFAERRVALTTLPFKGIVELTRNCNFKCVMCHHSWEPEFSRYDPAFDMSMELFKRVADQLFPTATFIDLRGFGETTILPWWPEVVDYLERFPYVEWHLVTNLSLPREETWDQMIRLGFTLGASIDGATSATFESIRRGGRFERVRHNLGVVRDAIREHGTGWIYFISTVQRGNLHELAALVRLAHEFEVPEVQFKIVQGGGPSAAPGAGHDEGLESADPATIARHVDDALAAALGLGVRVTFNDDRLTAGAPRARLAQAAAPRARRTRLPWPIEERAPFMRFLKTVDDASRVSVHQKCFKPYSYVYVNHLAELGTCNHMMFPDMLVMGDLRAQPLAEAWNSVGYREFRRQLVGADPRDARCQWCFRHRLED